MQPIDVLKLASDVTGGGGGGGADLRDGTYSSIEFDPDDATSFFTMLAAGTASGGDIDESSTGTYSWLLSGAAADYEVRATMISGSVSTGTVGSWLNMAATRSWTKIRTILNCSSCSFTLEIRPAGGGTVIDTCTISLEACVEI